MSRKAALPAVFFLISFLGLLPATGSAAPADGPGAARASLLNVKVTSTDSRPKIKVARKLKVLISCSNDCRASTRLKLITPINRFNVGGSRALGAGDVWTTGIRLTGFGLRYLKRNYRKSKLVVVVRATDRETGRKVSKTHGFRFYR
jgi:hypothetical protein